MENVVYFLNSKPYINLTNACTNACLFCIRDIKEDVAGSKLWMGQDNVGAKAVIDALEAVRPQIVDEVVFCGYGEPLIKLNEVLEVARYIKDNFKNVKVRINTNGHASLVHKKDVPKMLVGLVDCVSVSLNAQNEELYKKISCPKIENSYEGMKEFAQNCAKLGIETHMSVVSGYKNFDVDVKECEKIALSLGAKFKERPWIENGYN